MVKHREIDHFYTLCKLCQMPFNSIKGYTKHCNELHFNDSIACPMCNLNLGDNLAAASHFHLHSLRSFLCKKCDMSFVEEGQLALHSQTHVSMKNNSYKQLILINKSYCSCSNI